MSGNRHRFTRSFILIDVMVAAVPDQNPALASQPAHDPVPIRLHAYSDTIVPSLVPQVSLSPSLPPKLRSPPLKKRPYPLLTILRCLQDHRQVSLQQDALVQRHLRAA